MEVVDIAILKFSISRKNPKLDISGQFLFQKVIYGSYRLHFPFKSLYMDRTDHIFLVQSPYMDPTDHLFLVESPYMDRESVHFWKVPIYGPSVSPFLFTLLTGQELLFCFCRVHTLILTGMVY